MAPVLLDAFPLVNTCNFEELRASIAHIYTEPKIDVVDRRTTLPVTINHCQLEHMVLSYGFYGADVWMEFPETTFVSKIFPLQGHGEARIDGRTYEIGPGRTAVVSGEQDLKLTNYAGYQRLILRANASAMDATLEALLGAPIGSPLRFAPTPDDSTAAAEALRRHFVFLARQVNAANAPLPYLVQAEFEQTLLTMFLHANRHNYSHLLERNAPDASAQQVRLVEQYIEANWNKPLMLDALAAVAGVSVASLQSGFARVRGYSPWHFAKQTRLRHARQMLRRAIATTTVGDVAAECGYADPRAFEADYCAAFEERPADTLRRSRGEDLTRH